MAQLVNANPDLSLVSFSETRPIGLKAKRIADILLALSGIILLCPLLIFCSLAIAATQPGSVLFRHRRIGFGGKPFECLKFRTMVSDAEDRLREYLAADPQANAEWITARKLRQDPRITVIGAILRKTSLDELPQLFNVLKGDMSIVGPRPVTQDELVRYSGNIGSYLACRPGITGLWQVSGRSGTTYSKRVACDVFYAQNWSIVLDAKIIIVTIPAVLNSDNAY